MKKWYVLQTKPRKEFQVETLLEQSGFTVYNPKYLDDGRIKPFFPGYLFLKFRYPEDYRTVIYSRGVKRIVGNSQGPIPLGQEMISCLRSREKNGFIELMKYGEEPEPGDEVMVMEGPLKGLKGLFLKSLSDKERVMILLNYVSYQGSLLIEKNKIKKICRGSSSSGEKRQF